MLQQPPRLNLQPLRDAGNVIDQDIPLRALDSAQVSSVDIALKGQSFLTEPALGTQEPHVPRQDVS